MRMITTETMTFEFADDYSGEVEINDVRFETKTLTVPIKELEEFVMIIRRNRSINDLSRKTEDN